MREAVIRVTAIFIGAWQCAAMDEQARKTMHELLAAMAWRVRDLPHVVPFDGVPFDIDQRV